MDCIFPARSSLQRFRLLFSFPCNYYKWLFTSARHKARSFSRFFSTTIYALTPFLLPCSV